MGLVKMQGRCRQGLEGTLHGSNSSESNVSLVQIFPKMKNYTPYNRATSVGNQLLNNYRKFLLNYEICHRSRDLGGPLATPSAVTEVRDAIPQRILMRSSLTIMGRLQMFWAAPPQHLLSICMTAPHRFLCTC